MQEVDYSSAEGSTDGFVAVKGNNSKMTLSSKNQKQSWSSN